MVQGITVNYFCILVGEKIKIEKQNHFYFLSYQLWTICLKRLQLFLAVRQWVTYKNKNRCLLFKMTPLSNIWALLADKSPKQVTQQRLKMQIEKNILRSNSGHDFIPSTCFLAIAKYTRIHELEEVTFIRVWKRSL